MVHEDPSLPSLPLGLVLILSRQPRGPGMPRSRECLNLGSAGASSDLLVRVTGNTQEFYELAVKLVVVGNR